MVSIVLRGVVVLVVERGVSWRPMHHLRRLAIHHVAHSCVRTIRPARTCVRRENCVNEVIPCPLQCPTILPVTQNNPIVLEFKSSFQWEWAAGAKFWGLF